MSNLEDQKKRIEQVRKREEVRLIKLAQKAGLFQWRLTSAQIDRIFRDGLQLAAPQKQSQLLRLEGNLKVATKRQSEQERREDARRKILLGSFFIAQMEHKPDLAAQLASELEQFLDLHKDPKIAMQNKALLSDWLPKVPGAQEEPK